MWLRRTRDSELREEMQQHMAERAAELIAAGMARDAAFKAARREFGNVTLLEERSGDVWRWVYLENAARDLRHAVRRLRQSPTLTAICILTLALGLGANIALFSVVRSVLLKPLPFRDPDTLVQLYESGHEGKFRHSQVAGGNFLEWQRRSRSFEEMAFWGNGSRDLSSNGQLPERIQIMPASWNLFPMLGVPAAHGRLFLASDDRPQAAATALLTWGLFERRFGANPAIVGQTVLLDGKPHTIIGILPKWFSYPDTKTQLWIPAFEDAPVARMKSHGMHFWSVTARLRSGVSAARAQAELDGIQKRIHDEYVNEPALKGAELEPLIDRIVQGVKTPLYVLLGAVGCVLLITCLNVANLLIARLAVRRKELSVRAALGASKLRLLQEQMIESILLATGGCLAAMALASSAVRWIVAERKDIPRAEFIQMDATVFLFGAGITLVSAAIAGLIPATSALGDGLLKALGESSRSMSGNRSQAALRKILLGAEVAFTVVLLVCAGLLLKSFYQLRSVKVGFDASNVLTMQVSLPDLRYAKPAQKVAFYRGLMERVGRLPGVESAGLVNMLPAGGFWGDNLFTIREHPPLPKGEFQFSIARGADPGFFSTMKIPLIRGRTFLEHERLESARSAVVSQAFVSKFFPREDPLGKHLRLNLGGMADFEIVGVVGDTPFLVAEPVQPMMYCPLLAGKGFNQAALAVRARRSPASLALPIQKQIAQLDPELAVAGIMTMDDVIGKQTFAAAFDATLIFGFAMLSLLLAAVGLYGVLSYVVTQRTSELGIRLALGAKRAELLRLLLLDGMQPAVIGLAFGLAGGVAAARLLNAMLFGVKPMDITVLATVPLVVLGVAALACLLPAWRASMLDPIRALRLD